MANLSKGLKDSIKSKVFGKSNSLSSSTPSKNKSSSKSNFEIVSKIIATNMLSLPGIARDLNVARQTAQQLVRIMGGAASTKADAHFLKESEREKKLETKIDDEEKKKPQPVARDKKKSGLSKLKDQFSQSKFGKAFSKYFQIAAIIGIVFLAFKDTIAEWAKSLWETIKQKFNEFVGFIKEWFNEVVQPIIDKVKETINVMIDKISEFFKSIGEWFADKFGFIGEWFTNAFSFVGRIVDKFKSMIEGVKETLRNIYENSGPLKKLVPDFVVKFIGAKTETEKEEEKKREETQKKALANVVDDSREVKKLQRQQSEAQRVETERAELPKKQEERQQKVAERDKVAAMEKEKQYTGTDEIVRARLGLPTKAASEMEVGPEVAGPVTPLTPTPISAQPPTATAKESEGPAAATGGSLASVASVQGGVDLSGMNPEFEKRLVNMATAFKEETGKKLLITSAYRSNEKQAELFNAKLAQVGGDRAKARKMVAEPMAPLGGGRGSFHMKGLAIDINSKGPNGINALAGSRDSSTGWLEKFGLSRPVANEDWHVQPSGTIPTADNPTNPGAPTLVAGKDGKPMNVTEGKKESMPSADAKQTSAMGSTVAAASNDVAVSHREQLKPTTPVIVNAPTTNNTVVQNNQPAAKCKPNDTANGLVARVA